MRIQQVAFLGTLVAVLACTAPSRAGVDVRVSATFSQLSDYGEWVIVPGYGTVWRPYADPAWRPFMYGHWVYTTAGWVWDSDEPFGWIVCHYGNWYYDDGQGWVWLPGYDWSPARVRWYVTADEVGWAPLFPKARPGFPHHAAYMQWTFCPTRFFAADEVQSHAVIRARPLHGKAPARAYASPPRRELVQRAAGAPLVSIRVNKVRVTTRAKPLMRANLQSQQRPRAEAPVGPKYRRDAVQSEPKPRPNPPEGTVREAPPKGQTDQRDDRGGNNRGKGR